MVPTIMAERFELSSVVSYWDVDRDLRLTLGGVFKLLQEAAIKHADMYGVGTKAMTEAGESWVLNRLAASFTRFPRYEEQVRVVTWSAGIRGVRGYRELRLFCGAEQILAASTLWLYVKLETKSLAPVPTELAARFPVGEGEVFRPDIDKLRYRPLTPDAAREVVSLRYSDFDGNGHLNNTAYFDCLQTALARRGLPPRPRTVEMQFLKEVSPDESSVAIAVDVRETIVAFAFESGAGLHAQGLVRAG